MAKKYLTLQEAAAASGLSVDEIKNLRERGELRGFADRGNWKFREDDIEELKRSRQADSSPEVPILDDGGSSGSVLTDDDEAVAEQPTEISSGSDDVDIDLLAGESDSDVRLIMDEALVPGGEDSDPDVPAGDSDSDVRLVKESGSDSDVKLVETDSDSDVRLAAEPADDDKSDSDVKLIAESGESDIHMADDDRSDSDVTVVAAEDSSLPVDFADTDEDQPQLPSDSAVPLKAEEESATIDLTAGAGSGVALAADDSGITLENPADSGISLSADSPVKLTGDDESGISLELDDQDTTEGSTPMLEIPSVDEDLDETQLEIPSLDDDQSDFDLAMEDESGDSDADAVLFDEESGEAGATVVEDLDDDFGMDDEDDLFGEDEFEEATVVADEEDLDVFDAGDEDFDEEFDTGESHAGFAAPAAVAGRVAAPLEADWGIPAFVGLIFSTLLMIVCAMVSFDLVRSIWGYSEPNGLSSFLLETLSF